jgi:hypothetical protein
MSGPLELSDLELPEGFALQSELPPVIVHVARKPEFQPNLIVTAQPLAEGARLWRRLTALVRSVAARR